MKRFKRYTLVELILTTVGIIIVLSFVATIVGIVVGGCLMVRKVNDEGLKPAAERIREGPVESPEN